jgi:hypothetical protein
LFPKSQSLQRVTYYLKIFILTFGLGGSGAYLVYLFYTVTPAELPLCDNTEVKVVLLNLFQQHDPSLEATAFSQFNEDAFDVHLGQRECTAQLARKGMSAAFHYALNWQDRAQGIFSLRTDAAEIGSAHALFLLEPLPACDSAAADKALREIFAHLHKRPGIYLTDFSAITEIRFDTEHEQRVCQAVRHDSDKRSTPFFYRLGWGDKSRARLYVRLLDRADERATLQ